MDIKFKIIASVPWAEPLGMCGLEPEKEYPLIKIERVGSRHIIVYLKSELYADRDVTYQLPEAYADMVLDDDIWKIISGQIKYNLVRTIKECREQRFRFDHKNYTWDLALRRR